MRYSGAKETFDVVLTRLLPDRAPLRVLDAGCGGDLCIPIDRTCRLTGIDISPDSMARNTRLDERILGDLQTYRFPEPFDAIFCIDVVEHLPDPEAAVKNMCRSLAEGGVLVIKTPNVLSAKALITKYTPHAFHVFVLKRLFGAEHAGEPGHPPFPTFLRFSATPSRLMGILRAHGIEVAYVELFEGNQPIKLRRRSPFLAGLYGMACGVLDAVSGGRMQARRSELILIGRKTAPATATVAGPVADAVRMPTGVASPAGRAAAG